MSEVIEKKKLELNEKVEFSVVPVSPLLPFYHDWSQVVRECPACLWSSVQFVSDCFRCQIKCSRMEDLKWSDSWHVLVLDLFWFVWCILSWTLSWSNTCYFFTSMKQQRGGTRPSGSNAMWRASSCLFVNWAVLERPKERLGLDLYLKSFLLFLLFSLWSGPTFVQNIWATWTDLISFFSVFNKWLKIS